MPTDSHADLDEWIRGVMPGLHPLVQRLDELIREAIPGLHYAVKWKKAYYGLPELGWVIEMVAYDVSVNVVFYAGAEFDPPPPEGEGRSCAGDKAGLSGREPPGPGGARRRPYREGLRPVLPPGGRITIG